MSSRSLKVLALVHGYVGPSRASAGAGVAGVGGVAGVVGAPLNAGAEWMLHGMLRPLVEAGHSVEVGITSRRFASGDGYLVDGVQVIGGVVTPATLHETVLKADVLISHLQSVPLALAMAADRGKPVVVIEHNGHVGSKEQLLGQGRGGYRPSLLVYNSEWMAEDYAADPLSAEAVREIPSLVVHPPVIASERTE